MKHYIVAWMGLWGSFFAYHIVDNKLQQYGFVLLELMSLLGIWLYWNETGEG